MRQTWRDDNGRASAVHEPGVIGVNTFARRLLGPRRSSECLLAMKGIRPQFLRRALDRDTGTGIALMTRDLRQRLQEALGESYQLEHELGGGGMSRVFVATETALNRRVVLKVLPEKTAAQVSIERFKREIQLAAQLQQAHIVPLLSAGEAAGLPYYTMPLVDGESLRARLSRERELPSARRSVSSGRWRVPSPTRTSAVSTDPRAAAQLAKVESPGDHTDRR
jgi:serine/threonine protein kinase